MCLFLLPTMLFTAVHSQASKMQFLVWQVVRAVSARHQPRPWVWSQAILTVRGGRALLRPSQRPLCWPLWSGLIKERLSCVSFIHNRLRGEACIIMCQGSCQLEPSFCPGKMVSTSLLLAGRTDLDCPWYHSSQRSPLITRHSTVAEIIEGFCHPCTTLLIPKVPTRRAHQGTMTAIMRHLRTEVQPSFYQAQAQSSGTELLFGLDSPCTTSSTAKTRRTRSIN